MTKALPVRRVIISNILVGKNICRCLRSIKRRLLFQRSKVILAVSKHELNELELVFSNALDQSRPYSDGMHKLSKQATG